MALGTVQPSVHRVRRGNMQRLGMTNPAVIRGCKARTEVAPGAMPRSPVCRVSARRGVAVAPDTIILPVADYAAFAVSPRRDAVASGPPEIIVVPRHGRIVARHAVGLPVTHEAFLVRTARAAPAGHDCFSVELDPVPLVRVRQREEDPAILPLFRPCHDSRKPRAKRQQGQQDGGDGLSYATALRNHNASPFSAFGSARGLAHLRTRRSSRTLLSEGTCP